jgi:hypothetical protein
MWPNQISTSEREYHKRIIGVSTGKAQENGHFRRSVGRLAAISVTVFNPLDHRNALAEANWIDQFILGPGVTFRFLDLFGAGRRPLSPCLEQLSAIPATTSRPGS